MVLPNGDDIHVSGHPGREELIQMYDWVKPHILIPVHGEARHLIEQARLGDECGIKKTVVPHNGSLISLDPKNPKIIADVESGYLALDGKRMLEVGCTIIKERAKMSTDGLVSVSVVVDKNYNLKGHPDVSFMGLVDLGERTRDFQIGVSKEIKKALSHPHRSHDVREKAIKQAVRQFVNGRIGKKPITLLHWHKA